MEENIPTTNQPEPTTQPELNKKASLLPPTRTIALIVVLILVTVGLVYLASYNYEKPKEEANQQQEDKSKLIQTSLSLSNPTIDSTSTTSAVPVYTMNINADTGENKLTVVQLELQYDPLALANVDITPGDLNKEWTEVKKEIDEENGIIYYILGINMKGKSVNGTGTVAKLTFSKAFGFEFTESAIRFLPRTLVMTEGYDKPVLKSWEDLIFTFPAEEEELTPAPLEEVAETTTTTTPLTTN